MAPVRRRVCEISSKASQKGVEASQTPYAQPASQLCRGFPVEGPIPQPSHVAVGVDLVIDRGRKPGVGVAHCFGLLGFRV